MKIVIPGGSGQVGTVLSRAFHGNGHEVVILSRQPLVRPWRVVRWDGATLGDWSKELDGCAAVINLAGRSVNCRYTATNRKAILESRVLSTRIVGQAIAAARDPPRVWLQSSTATIYAHRYDAPNDEKSGVIGGAEPNAPRLWRFSIDVARAWEAAFGEAVVPRTRKIALRSAVIMSPDRGGIFDTFSVSSEPVWADAPAMAGSTCRGFTRTISWRLYVGYSHTNASTGSSTWLRPIPCRTQSSCECCGRQPVYLLVCQHRS